MKQHSGSRNELRFRPIAAQLRAEILNGLHAPGGRLPTRRELLGRFGSTHVTIQKALDRLADLGYVRADGRRGTFVADPLPVGVRYALVFPFLPDLYQAQFYVALRAEVEKASDSRHAFPIFYDIRNHRDAADYRRLLALVQSHQISGLIFASSPHELGDSPLVTEPGIPRVIFQAGPGKHGIPTVHPDGGFLPRAFEYLAARGRRRVAAIIQVRTDDLRAGAESVRAAAAACGLTIRPEHIQGAHPETPHCAHQIARLLMSGPRRERPEALIVDDDNLVAEATAGLVAAGVQAPRDLDIVAHANFPWPTPSAVPARRLGFDVTHVVAACIDILDRQRRGETPPGETLVPALWEEEVSGRGTASSAKATAAMVDSGQSAESKAPGGRASSRAAAGKVPPSCPKAGTTA